VKSTKKDQLQEKLTIDELKTFEGFEGVSNEEAASIIESIDQFSILSYQLFQSMTKEEYERFIRSF
jgi:hypothetical protein